MIVEIAKTGVERAIEQSEEAIAWMSQQLKEMNIKLEDWNERWKKSVWVV